MSRRIAGINIAPPTNPIFKCPSCDIFGASIATKIHAVLNAFGEVDSTGTWYYKSHAKCLYCGHTGPLGEFDIEQQEEKKS